MKHLTKKEEFYNKLESAIKEDCKSKLCADIYLKNVLIDNFSIYIESSVIDDRNKLFIIRK